MSDDVKMDPVPVIIIRGDDAGEAERVEQLAPAFGIWRSITLTGAETGSNAFQLIGQEPKRHRAVIIIQPGLAGAVLGNIWIGQRQQVMQPAPTGGQLVNGNSIVYEAQPELWVAADSTGTHSLTITWLDERFA